MKKIFLYIFILTLIIFSSLIPFAESGYASDLWNAIMGSASTKEIQVNVKVYDSDTKNSLWGSQVTLNYNKKMKADKRKNENENYECEGKIDSTTDREGRTKLVLKVVNCPTRDIETEKLYITVNEQGYATYRKEVKDNNIDIALERLGYLETLSPININYPKYIIDIGKYKENFSLINERNKQYYLLEEYSHEDNLEKFLEKVAFISNINAVPFLRDIMNNKYLSLYKKVFRDNEARRSRDYIGQESIASALLNIADDSVDELLPISTNIPYSYLKFLDDVGIRISLDDYWDYLSGKYISNAHNFLIDRPPSIDPLTFVIYKLKEKYSKSSKYADYVFNLYKVASANNLDKEARQIYNWQIDKNRLANELFDLNSPMFTAEVKILLQNYNTEENSMIRKYLLYLYKQQEYDYLVTSLKDKKNLMNAFLAEDVKETTAWNTVTGEGKDLGIEQCLITRMPKVTEKIKNEIEAYLKETSTSPYFYRWLVRNLSFVNRHSAEDVLRRIYSEEYEKNIDINSYIEGKRAALRGAVEGRLNILCSDVYDDLQMKTNLKKDYFSIARARMFYLNSICPNEFNKIVSEFSVSATKAQMKNIDNGGGSIWQGVEDYFPINKAIQIFNEYICNNGGTINSIYYTYPPKYPIKCLCERFEKDIHTLKNTNLFILTEYLGKCYPAQKQGYRRISMPDWDREITDRSYQGLTNVLKKYSPPIMIFEKKYRAFFLGTTTDKFESTTMIDWYSGIDSNKAFPVLEQAANSQDQMMVRAALYSYSFYPSKYTPQIISQLKNFASHNKYPEYLYAAYSLAMNNPSDEIARSACRNAFAYHTNIINNRLMNRFDSEFAFNVLINLELSAKIKDEEQYLQLLNLIFMQNSLGRYELFQRDLERIITNNDIKIDKLIEELFSSADAFNIVLGIQLAQLKKYKLELKSLERMLSNDDSYVRLAAANYIKKNKENYIDLDKNLKNNSNIKIRRCGKELSPILDIYATDGNLDNIIKSSRIRAGDY